jgi:hypothetical protein
MRNLETARVTGTDSQQGHSGNIGKKMSSSPTPNCFDAECGKEPRLVFESPHQ